MARGSIQNRAPRDEDPNDLAIWIHLHNAFNRRTIGPHNVRLIPYSNQGYTIRLLGHWRGYNFKGGSNSGLPPHVTSDPFDYLQLPMGTMVSVQYCHVTGTGGSSTKGYVQVQSLRFKVVTLHGDDQLKPFNGDLVDEAGYVFGSNGRMIHPAERGLDLAGLDNEHELQPEPAPEKVAEQAPERLVLRREGKFGLRVLILEALHMGPNTRHGLADDIGIEYHNVVNHVQTLLKAGYVATSGSRGKEVSITEHGREELRNFLHGESTRAMWMLDVTPEQERMVGASRDSIIILNLINKRGPQQFTEMMKILDWDPARVNDAVIPLIENDVLFHPYKSRQPYKLGTHGADMVDAVRLALQSPSKPVEVPEAPAPRPEPDVALEAPKPASTLPNKLHFRTERVVVSEEKGWFRTKKVYKTFFVVYDKVTGEVVRKEEIA